jgi:hypothetical protein
LTLRWVPGTEHASVTRVVDEHTLRTSAATDYAASACDRLQNQTQQGPAFDAIGDHATIRVDDLSGGAALAGAGPAHQQNAGT